jgi:hypothetical protein
MAKPSGGAVVRMLRAAPDRTLPIKTLRKAVAQLLECDDNSELKKGVREVLEALEQKGRVKLDGKVVHLPKSKKNKKADNDDDSDAKEEDQKSSKKVKKEIPTASVQEPVVEKVDKNPSWGHGGSNNSSSWSGEPNKGDTGTRVFLGKIERK